MLHSGDVLCTSGGTLSGCTGIELAEQVVLQLYSTDPGVLLPSWLAGCVWTPQGLTQ